MATPLLLMASGQTASEDKTGALFGTEGIKPEAGKTRGRKSSRGPSQKKQPQRGLGVAQLERLRLQERCKKIAEIPQVQSFNHLDPQRQYKTPILPCTDQVGSVPVQFGAPLHCAPTPVVNGCGGLVVQRVGNGGGFGGLYYGGSSGMGAVVMGDQVGMDAYGGIGDPDPRVFVGTVFETSKELSSMPKMHYGPQHCDVCFKIKYFNGRNIGFNGGRENYSEISPLINSSHDFMESNLENIPNLTGETCNFGGTAPSRSCRNLDDQGVEVVAVHRKGNSRGGSVLMEYEFFPGKNGRGTSSKALEEASVAVDGEASYLTSAAYSSTSNSVDLSLKLSY
ncbi:hypothetical protein I3843_11G174100 [Carya illinoinensis]|nr:hypothetical protein I3843_11G174100 [Carya illinoinensis]